MGALSNSPEECPEHFLSKDVREAEEKRFPHLYRPIKIDPVELKNRIALAPMNETTSGVDGEATGQMLSYCAARVKGGAGRVSTGC